MRILNDFEKQRLRENTERNKNKMWEIKTTQPCADCGLRWHPQALSFDHIDRRTVTKNKNAKSLNTISYYKPEMFDRQLKNMSLVCLNCHRIREIKRDIDHPLVNKHKQPEVKVWLEKCKKGALL